MKIILAIAIFAVIPQLSTPVTDDEEGTRLGKGQYEINCVNGAVTVRANDANVPDLLREFSRKSGVTFNKYIGKTQTITLDLSGVTDEEFLNRVLGSYVATSKKKNGTVHISRITIMDEGGEDGGAPREPPSRLEPKAPPEGPGIAPGGPAREEGRPPWRKDRSARSSRRRMRSEARLPASTPRPPDSTPPPIEESREVPTPAEQQPEP